MKSNKRSYLITTHEKLATEFVSCDCTSNCSEHNPKNTTKGSHRYFIWRCSNNHLYRARVNSRASGGKVTNCAQCSKASIPNSMDKIITKFPDLYAILKNCLDHEDCDKSKLTTGSNCNYLIVCLNGHTYSSTIYNATRTTIGCHICQRKTLATDFHGSKFIRCLCKSCQVKSIHHEENLSIKSTKVALWECSNCKKHWEAKIADRTSSDNKMNCPLCIPNATSLREQSIMSQLALLLNITYQGPSYVSGWRYPVDFYTPDDKVVVQYDSYYYHRLKEDSDKNCNELLTKAGYKIIRVREKPLLATSKNDIFITKKDSAEKIANKVYNIIKQR